MLLQCMLDDRQGSESHSESWTQQKIMEVCAGYSSANGSMRLSEIKQDIRKQQY
jgi:hypothetical protein